MPCGKRVVVKLVVEVVGPYKLSGPGIAVMPMSESIRITARETEGPHGSMCAASEAW
jgi:hypothetical protein